MAARVFREIINFFEDNIAKSRRIDSYKKLLEFYDAYYELLENNSTKAIKIFEKELEEMDYIKEKYQFIPIADPKNSTKEILIIKRIKNGGFDKDKIQLIKWLKHLKNMEGKM